MPAIGGGLLVTLLSWSASSGGSTYVLAWGAILFGVINLIVGYNQLARIRARR